MGVFLPARASAGTIGALHKAIGAALATDAVKAGLARLGLEPWRPRRRRSLSSSRPRRAVGGKREGLGLQAHRLTVGAAG
jgi:hypothetical protein